MFKYIIWSTKTALTFKFFYRKKMIFIKKKDFVKISDVCGDLNIVITLLLFKSSGTESDPDTIIAVRICITRENDTRI